MKVTVTMKILKYEYYFWRGLYITVKPLSLLLAASFGKTDFINLLALAILFSGTLMASLSMGSYRDLFVNHSNKVKYNYLNNTRKAIFKINASILIFIALFFSFFYSIELCLFIVFFIITEHIIHDESRILLYGGNREGWAKNNCLRSLFIPLIPLLIFVGNDEVSPLFIMFVLFVFNGMFSYFKKGLLNTSKISFYLLFRRRFYYNYTKCFNYFVSATTNRMIQQSDKFLFSIISYELLWVYTLLCQMLNIPLVMFEMVFMSELKSKVAKLKIHCFTWLNSKQIKVLTIITIVSLLIYSVTSFYIPELLSIEFMMLVAIICCSNYLSALSMQNSEKLFWYLGDANKYRKLEMFALIVGHIIFAPLVLIAGNHMLVKLPNIISVLVKLRNSKKWLAS